jgi:hypothetical protein
MSDQEKWYWDDWSAIHKLDDELGHKIGEPDATLESISAWLAQWVREPVAREAEPPHD